MCDRFSGCLALISAEADEDTLKTACLNVSVYRWLRILNAEVDLHAITSAMLHLTECTESMRSFLLRRKIDLLITMTRHFTAKWVTTTVGAAIADMDALTGGLLCFSHAEDDTRAAPSLCSPRSPARHQLFPPHPGSSHPGSSTEKRITGLASRPMPPSRAAAAAVEATAASAANSRTPLPLLPLR